MNGGTCAAARSLTMRKLKTVLLCCTAALLLLAGAAEAGLYWWTGRGLERLAQREASWLRIGHGRHWAWLWGAGWIDRLELQPQDWYNALWQLPLGFTLQVDRVEVDGVRLRPDGSLQQAHLRLHGLHLPVPDLWGWTYPLGPPGEALAQPPGLYQLGYTELQADADLQLGFAAETHSLRLDGDVRIAGLGDFNTDCTLDAGAELLDGDSSRLGLRRCRLRFDEAGLAGRFEQRLAQQAGIGLPRLQGLLLENFDRWSRRNGVTLDPGSRAALEEFLRRPRALELVAAPAQQLPFYRLRQAPPRQWCSALGLSLRLP